MGSSPGRRHRPEARSWPLLLRILVLVLATCGAYYMFSGFGNNNVGRMGQSLGRAALSSWSAGPILVSYSYFEKDNIQVRHYSHSGHCCNVSMLRLNALRLVSHFGGGSLCPLQRDNFHFFMTIAMGLDNVMDRPRDLEFVIVQSGDKCTPCSRLEPRLRCVGGRARSVCFKQHPTWVGDTTTSHVRASSVLAQARHSSQ